MTRANDTTGRPAGLSVTEMFSQYLKKQIDAHAVGLGHADSVGDAVPHDATPVQPVDPAVAWKDASSAGRLLSPNATAFDVPPDWPTLVAKQEPAVALAFALGNFPQLVRNVYPLLSREPAALRDGPREAVAAPALCEWASEATGESARLLAAGVLRLARQFDVAEQVLAFTPSEANRYLHANERAALAWHRGNAETALALWQTLPDNPVTRFNCGMAQLFLGRNVDAAQSLSAAVAKLPENSAWHHLAQLYLALAKSR